MSHMSYGRWVRPHRPKFLEETKTQSNGGDNRRPRHFYGGGGGYTTGTRPLETVKHSDQRGVGTHSVRRS